MRIPTMLIEGSFKTNCMIIRTRTNVDKSYFIKALTWYIYRNSINTMEGISKKKALEILRNSVYWNGRHGWTSDGNTVTDDLGEFEAFDKYQECQKCVEEYVEKYFPNFK